MPVSVFLSQKSQKQLEKIPIYIKIKLLAWIEAVENEGLQETRKHLGYHDEPLQGKRQGQRSIRLNRAYRAIYLEFGKSQTKWIEILEVTHHEY